MTVTYTPKGVCSRLMKVDVEDGIVKHVEVVGGCDGNLKGIVKLVEGMDAAEAVKRMSGITCGPKGTSCPDQLAKAISQAIEK
jgi:uncharacterized protein (TIGR03905 family)